VCKRGDCWSTRHTKEEREEAREGFKRRVHQYLVDNNINDDFDKDIAAIAVNTSTPTAAPTSGNFFYNDYGIKHFITSNGPIPIKTAKNIVMSMNNDAFTYGLTSSIEPSTEPSTVRRGNNGNRGSNDKGKSATYLYNNNPPDLTINIDFLNCHFNDNR
jgi:hypothetical protein